MDCAHRLEHRVEMRVARSDLIQEVGHDRPHRRAVGRHHFVPRLGGIEWGSPRFPIHERSAILAARAELTLMLLVRRTVIMPRVEAAPDKTLQAFTHGETRHANPPSL